MNDVAPNRLTLAEKGEGMSLAPVLEESATQDIFLFVANDNNSLASATAAMASESVNVPTGKDNLLSAGLGVQGNFGTGLWHVGYTAEFGNDDRFGHVVTAGVGYKF